MTPARRTEGPRAPLFYSVLLGLSGVAAAQTVDMSALEACSMLETEAEKLACFEAIVSGGEVAPVAEPAAEPVGEPVPETPAEPVPSAAPIMVVPAAAPAALSVESKSPAATTRAPMPQAAEPDAPAPAAMTDDDFGSEHLVTRTPEEPRILNARVVDVTKGNHDALVFHLDNGQIWRQIQPRYYPYPRNREFDATITTGILGEYQLQVEGKGRKVNIRRLK